MKALAEVVPTDEQLALFSRVKPGVEVIRGAAGSGKTTTAVLKLRQAVGFFLSRLRRRGETRSLRVLVLTFNRTLRGYVTELAERQFQRTEQISLEISTFSKWAIGLLGPMQIMEHGDQTIRRLGAGLPFDDQFMVDETEYVLGRFLPEDLPNYLTARRDGRGNLPRMDRAARELFLSTVILPYQEFKAARGLTDWNDLAVLLQSQHVSDYDIIVVDETQDFSANQVRAIMAQAAAEHTVTFVLDSAQRIYARSFTWQEVGITVRPENSYRLTSNYRNTKQIARFAASILAGIQLDDDGSMPDLNSARREGPLPVVLEGRYSAQLRYVTNFIESSIDLEEETVAFLHPKGGQWLDFLRSELTRRDLGYCEITRNNEWPQGPENIALSTLHSAKGLEFDHVFILGLNDEVTAVNDSERTNSDEQYSTLRRLIAMGVGRARKTVMIGYKPDDRPKVAELFTDDTFERVAV